MTPDRALADQIDREARQAWDAVPDHLRQPKVRERADGQVVAVFSDGGQG